MKKFYATRPVFVDGKQYNMGDIVMADRQHPGLRESQNQPHEKPAPRPRARRSDLLGAERPEVSVIVTFHDQERFVKDCMDGFAEQIVTFPYEVIALVDRSKEREFETIRREYPNVRAYECDFGNASAARNYGMTLAGSGIVCFFDGDDYPFPTYIQELRDALESHAEGEEPADFAYARFEHDLFGLQKGNLARCNTFEWSESWSKFSPVTNTPIMIRAGKAPTWDERLDVMQDFAYGLRLSQARLKAVHVRKELWKYRYHDASVWGGQGIADRKAAAQKILREEYGWDETRADVTFISLISRDEVMEEYFGQIPRLDIPKKSHWLLFLDTDDEALISKAKAYQARYEKNFLSSRMYVTGETNLAYDRNFEERGMRIANFIRTIINQCAQKIGGTPYLFMVEDDTLAPKRAYTKLLPLMKRSRNTAYASGIECGRGFTKHTGICWLKKDRKGEIVGRTIPKMKKDGIEAIGGGGWYCWIGRIDLLKTYLQKMPMRCFDGKMLGPDVMMVHDLREMGLDAWCDLSVQCFHRDARRKVWLPAMTGKGYEIEYVKNKLGLWEMRLQETL